VYASNESSGVASDYTRQQLPTPSGGDVEIPVGATSGLSLFLSAGGTYLEHDGNRYEAAYDAVLPTVTIGADYWITPQLLAGAAFNYTNFDGNYDGGGGIDNDIYSPTLYLMYLPNETLFINAILSYSRGENSNRRHLSVKSANDEEGPPIVSGIASADYSEDIYSGELQAGYDFKISSFNIGPRLGVAIAHSHTDSYKENGGEGLQLRYSNLDQTSVQSSVGAAVSYAVAIPNGTLLPQASVAWVHEYAASARNVDAHFVEAPTTSGFTFDRERPARNWAILTVGLSAAFTNGLQPFVQFATMQGNENFESYGGTAGLRFSF
jgi:outer membrane autotransporter protein